MSRSTISTFTLFELFPDEASARTYLESRLWRDGVTCPECKGKERVAVRKDGYYRCNPCKLDFTVRTGTIFERSHVPLQKWLYAMYLLVSIAENCRKLQDSKEVLPILDRITDHVLAYKPKPKTKAAKKRSRRKKRKSRE
jgi:transposase-like protein